ncbi:hypothetical protein [Streptomyces sp. NPDC060366]|uniref:hypothetical protein n=1 Tax=Streptomyces sp. NPDC060366 TaxID=3347105 RepID=UPI0036586D72
MAAQRQLTVTPAHPFHPTVKELLVVLSVSLVLLTGVIVGFLVHTGYQRIVPGLVTALFGFSLASTGIAPGITSGIESIAGWLASLG